MIVLYRVTERRKIWRISIYQTPIIDRVSSRSEHFADLMNISQLPLLLLVHLFHQSYAKLSVEIMLLFIATFFQETISNGKRRLNQMSLHPRNPVCFMLQEECFARRVYIAANKICQRWKIIDQRPFADHISLVRYISLENFPLAQFGEHFDEHALLL